MMTKRVYIFDFDGTLVDSMPSWSAKMLNILHKTNTPYPADVVRRITVLGDTGTAKYFKEELGVPLTFEEMYAMMDEFALPKYRDEILLKDGVREYLAGLREAGASLGVLPASPHRMVDPCLKRLGIFDWFERVRTSEDFGKVKSDPTIYADAAAEFGVKPADVVFFDDNIGAVKTAAYAGMRTVGVYDATGEDFADELRAAADYYVTNLGELPGNL